MKIERFEDIEGWKLARELTNLIYDLTDDGQFAKDWGLWDQIRRAAGSAMHNIAEGFDGGTNPEFLKYLRYAQRSCSEVKSQLYLAKDRDYLTQTQFDDAFGKAESTHRKIGGFIHYLTNQKASRKPPTKN